jgi:tRNA threonylcarbamoyl adenosine modification protein YeaZ
MNILAFDTCLDKMYVTLAIDGEVKESRIVLNHDEKYHSAFLISTIKDVLKKNNIKPEDIDLIATNIGPGSFTGIRACTTVARVMAQQLSCKCIGISSLEILSKITGEKSCPVALDARKNKAYFYFENEIKGAVDIEEVKALLKGKQFITDNKLQQIIGGNSYQETEAKLGDILAKLAYEKYENCDCDWRKLKPLYIQPPPMG